MAEPQGSHLAALLVIIAAALVIPAMLVLCRIQDRKAAKKLVDALQREDERRREERLRVVLKRIDDERRELRRRSENDA